MAIQKLSFMLVSGAFKQIRKLSGRKITKIYGKDAPSFLQGLQTNDVSKMTENSALYSCFLNTNGSVLFDLFLYKMDNVFFLDYDTLVHDYVLKHILRYKLNKNIYIELDNDLSIHWNSDKSQNDILRVRDPRLDDLGFRSIRKKDADHQNDEIYVQRRYSLGVAEGMKEIPIGEHRPFALNFDILNAIAGDKGCYIGQEFVAKYSTFSKPTRFVMSLRFDGMSNNLPKDSYGCQLSTSDGNKIGTVIGVANGVILAIVNANKLYRSRDSLFIRPKGGELFQEVKVHVPPLQNWLRTGRDFDFTD